MASKRKRFVSAITQDELLQRFYDELDNEETDFLGNTFNDDDNANQPGYSESESDSDHNNYECKMEVNYDSLTGPMKKFMLLLCVSRTFQIWRILLM